jgi:hypothetical protein
MIILLTLYCKLIYLLSCRYSKYSTGIQGIITSSQCSDQVSYLLKRQDFKQITGLLCLPNPLKSFYFSPKADREDGDM